MAVRKDDSEDVGEPRIPDKTERNAATSFRDHAEGPPKQVEPKQGRPNDYEIQEHTWALENSTLAGRAERAKRVRGKQVDKSSDEVEDKQVSKRAAAKK